MSPSVKTVSTLRNTANLDFTPRVVASHHVGPIPIDDDETLLSPLKLNYRSPWLWMMEGVSLGEELLQLAVLDVGGTPARERMRFIFKLNPCKLLEVASTPNKLSSQAQDIKSFQLLRILLDFSTLFFERVKIKTMRDLLPFVSCVHPKGQFPI